MARVYSIPRKVIGTDERIFTVKGGILKPFKNGGYLKVTLMNPKKSHGLHKLVAKHFLIKPESDQELIVLHGPKGYLDNSIYNLSWGTRSQNELDKIRDGVHPMVNKSYGKCGHLLVYPNLRKEKDRTCKACKRGWDWTRNHPELKDIRKEVSDIHYELIMNNVTTPLKKEDLLSLLDDTK